MTEPRALDPPSRRIFHAAGLPMLLVDPRSGLIEDVNDALCRFYGRGREELVGHTLTAISRSTPDRLRDALSVAAVGGASFAVTHVTASGREVPVTVTASPVEIDGRLLLVEVVTERGTGRDARSALALLYEATSDIHRALIRAKSEAELWSQASRIIVEVAGFRLAWISVVDEATGLAKVVGCAGAVAYLDGRVDDLGTDHRTPTAQCITTGRTIVQDDIAADISGPYAERAIQMGLRSGAAVPMRDGDGTPFGALVVLEERRAAVGPERVALLERLAGDLGVARALIRTSERLRASEVRYRSIVEQASAGIMVFDDQDSVLDANAAACAMLGYSLAELRALGSGLILQDIDAEEEAGIRDILASGASLTVDRRFRRATGEVITVDFQGRLREDGYVEAVVQDVTAERRVRDALRASEARYRDLVSSLQEGIITYDGRGRVTEMNEAARILHGVAGFEFTGRDARALAASFVREDGSPFPPDELPTQVALRTGRATDRRIVGIPRRDGSIRWVSSNAVPTGLDAAGRPSGIVVSFADVTALREALGRAEASEDRVRTLLEEALDSIVVFDVDGVVSYANPAAEALLQIRHGALLGRSVFDLVPAGEHGRIAADLDRVAAGHPVAGEYAVLRSDGVEVLTEVSASRLPDGRIEAFARDITARRALEAERNRLEREQDARLAQEARLDAIAQLAGGVAHDLNNVLTMIVGHAALLDPLTATPADIAAGVGAITEAASRAETLTTRLLAFGRRAFLQPRQADLRDLLGHIQPMLVRAAGPRIALVVSPGADAMPVNLDPNLFEQALLALVVHARNAMPDGGTLRLRTEWPRAGEALPGVDAAVLVLADDGPSLAPERLARLFEPFASVGGDPQGLGLAMVHGFVEQSGGRVEVSSEPGEGTMFRILLPLAAVGAEPVQAASVAQPARSGPATILVADDEAVLRLVAERTLRARGYDVLTASSGEEALALATAHQGRIDLLFSDVVMPGLRGPGLAAALLQTRPDMRVLLTSGYAEDVVGRRTMSTTPGHFLAKPYTPSMLAAAVARLLEPDGGSADAGPERRAMPAVAPADRLPVGGAKR